MPDPERPRLVPRIREARHGEGHEVEFEKVNRFGERASSLIVGELSMDDLESLYQELGAYLDTERRFG